MNDVFFPLNMGRNHICYIAYELRSSATELEMLSGSLCCSCTPVGMEVGIQELRGEVTPRTRGRLVRGSKVFHIEDSNR